MSRKLISNGNPLENVIGFSRVVRVGNFISVGGTASRDTKGETVGIGDVSAQTRRCIEIIKEALEMAGSGLQDVVRTRTLLIDINDWEKVAKVRSEYFKDIRPVDTVVQVSKFINPEWLIEIEVDAIVDEHEMK